MKGSKSPTRARIILQFLVRTARSLVTITSDNDDNIRNDTPIPSSSSPLPSDYTY